MKRMEARTDLHSYMLNVFASTQSCESWVVYCRLAFKDCRDLDPEYVSCWCRHEFEPHSQPFLLTYLKLIKSYNVLPSVSFVSDRILFLKVLFKLKSKLQFAIDKSMLQFWQFLLIILVHRLFLCVIYLINWLSRKFWLHNLQLCSYMTI